MIKTTGLRVKIFADGAVIKDMLDLYKNPLIKGFTTNPTLMRQGGVSDYEDFIKEATKAIPDRPISFEVFADDFDLMFSQAKKIASLGKNLNVKIPITNTLGESSLGLIEKLAGEGVKLNVTAMMTAEQIEDCVKVLKQAPPSYLSLFAGRVADSGIDPVPVMKRALQIMAPYPQLELIWASPREVFNIIQANDIGCHIITVSYDLLKKLPLLGKDLTQYSLETVQMFYKDAKSAGFKL